MQNTLIALVENKPGVLNRVASLFRRRNFNIESLSVGHTENPEISRMTIVVDDNVDARKVETNLYKLVNVIDVQDVTNQAAVTKQCPYLFGRRVRRNIEVLRVQTHQCIANRPAYQERLVACFVQSIQHLECAVGDFVA